MVFVNDKKYACETCIKGHRSSTCNHTERPLFEIKKKGRPITQCEHCRELRKTKQVHVKCLCEGREDPEAVSHSIPAKKANRKGPPPCAAFPNGIQHLSGSEVSGIVSRSNSKHALKAEVSASTICTCRSSGTCDCCASRRTSRAKRSTSPPSIRPKVGDMAAPHVHGVVPPSYPASDVDSVDVKIEHEPHVLIHGHNMRMTHGSSLYNPYGLAHGMHQRSNEMRSHDNEDDVLFLAAEETRKDTKYVYPTLPLSYDLEQQQQNFGSASEVSPMWSNGERLSGNVENSYSSYDIPEQVNNHSQYNGPTFGSVNVDAWLRQLAESNANSYAYETNTSPSQPDSSLHYPSDPSTQCLPVPPPIDVSQKLASNRESDFPTSNHYDLLPQFMSLGIEFNESNFLSDNDQEYKSNGNGAGSDVGADMYTYSSSAPSAPSNDFLAAPTPFTALPPLSSMLTPCDIGPSSAPPSSVGDYEVQNHNVFGFDYTTLLDPDYVIQPLTNLPALSRSSSTGSHASSRSRSSVGLAGPYKGHASVGASVSNPNLSISIPVNTVSSDVWHSAPIEASAGLPVAFPEAGGSSENMWGARSAYPMDTARDPWAVPSRATYVHKRSRSRSLLQVPQFKPDITLPFK